MNKNDIDFSRKGLTTFTGMYRMNESSLENLQALSLMILGTTYVLDPASKDYSNLQELRNRVNSRIGELTVGGDIYRHNAVY